jgi:putative MFS transporter
MPPTAGNPKIALAVFVAALGYFVDAYDIMLFSIIRTKSLLGIGVAASDVFGLGVELLNWQLIGLLLGGIFWGVLGDKKGRLSVLFGSILLYSIANIANGFTHSVESYRWLRFLAGVGLAGELGAGITLVSEIMSKESRGWGTTIIATTGVTGVAVACLVGQVFDWRTAFFVGGGMGLVLLVLRLGVYESGMFQQLLEKPVERGNFGSLFTSRRKFILYSSFVLVALPVWYVAGILMTFSPEIGQAFGLAEVPASGQSIFFAYLGLTAGDFVSGAFSQFFQNRKKVIFCFLILNSLSIIAFHLWAGISLRVFYGFCLGLGFSAGYWAVAIVSITEQFGTNIRATVTTTAPNFVRGSAVLLTLAFKGLRPAWGALGATAWLGLGVIAMAFLALRNLKETYGADLDYTEPA